MFDNAAFAFICLALLLLEKPPGSRNSRTVGQLLTRAAQQGPPTASPRIPKRIPGRSIKDSQQLKHSKVGKRPLSRSANEVDEWTEAAARKNVMPLVRLRCRSTARRTGGRLWRWNQRLDRPLQR